jgi:hypothetical protein
MPSKRGRGRQRQHTYRKPKEGGNLRFRGQHHCPACGKWAYTSRDEAISAVRLLHPGATVHYYKCLGWWHFTSMTAQQVSDIRAQGAVITEDDEDWEDVA